MFPAAILKNIGVVQKPLSEAAEKRLKAGLLAGKGRAEVASGLGGARQTVYTWGRLLDEAGLQTGHKQCRQNIRVCFPLVRSMLAPLP